MFNSRKSDKLDLVVGKNSRVMGDVESSGTILVEGTITGNLHSNKVILSERSYVKGDISANNIAIAGKVEGQVKAKESIEVKATAHISGYMLTRRLSMMRGAIFNGMSSMDDAGQGQREEAEKNVVEFAVKER